ncbi:MULTISPECIES: hypothetical protein [unclassified Rickettsia]
MTKLESLDSRLRALLRGSNFRCHSYTPLCHSRVGGALLHGSQVE